MVLKFYYQSSLTQPCISRKLITMFLLTKGGPWKGDGVVSFKPFSVSVVTPAKRFMIARHPLFSGTSFLYCPLFDAEIQLPTSPSRVVSRKTTSRRYCVGAGQTFSASQGQRVFLQPRRNQHQRELLLHQGLHSGDMGRPRQRQIRKEDATGMLV